VIRDVTRVVTRVDPRLVLAFAVAVALTAACRRLPPPEQMRRPPDSDAATDTRGAGDSGDEAARGASRENTLSPRAAAIIDSIEAAVRDSFAALRDSLSVVTARDSVVRAEATRRDSIARAEQARQDSIARAEEIRQDSVRVAAEAARRDSIAAIEEAARRDSIARGEAARQDSIAVAVETARQDSIADARARADSMAAAIEAIRRDSIAAAMAAATMDVERLKELGPSYIPYDEGPRVVWNTETQAQLSVALLPVLREESLPARTKTTFWVLVSREGRVADVVVQTPSESKAFDEAAAAFAETLTFSPAIRAGRPVPAWVLREISILMR